MVYRIGVCDDCAAEAEYITALAAAWGECSGNTVTIKSFSSAEAFWVFYEGEKDFDMLLLDIEMGELSGMELAKRIRQENGVVQIIFITGFPDFMAEGYDVSALHYLMKPVSKDVLFAVLDRAAANLGKQERVLRVVFDRQTDLVPLDRILYLEAQKQFVLIHTAERVYRMKASLHETEAALSEHFFRCQRSFLVNLAYVAQIRGSCVVLKNGEEVPISRGMAETISREIVRLF